MAFCSFAESFGMFDVTPVENLFIEEYMARAPGDYVKVYLYGLRLCYHPQESLGVSALARSLSLEEDVVRDAFAYWEKQGVLRRMTDQPPTYSFLNLKAKLFGRGAPEDQQLYSYRSFNNSLQRMFGARLLKPAEYTRAAEWVEQLHMTKETALLMVQYAIDTKGANVSFPYMEKIAVEWARNGILAQEAAREYLLGKTKRYEGASRVLKAMRLRRAPTVKEEQVYAKWTEEWGFSQEAIEEAMGQLNKISNPNFEYLDKVLETLYKRGGANNVKQSIQDDEQRRAPVREVLSALGIGGAPTQDLIGLYESFLSKGFDHDAVLLAAAQVRRSGGRSMVRLNETLAQFLEKGLLTGQDIQTHLSALQRERDALRALKSRAGDETEATPAEIRLYRAMEGSGLSAELLMLAAELSRGKKEPIAYAARIVSNWKEKGIHTLDAARADHEARMRGGQESAQTESKGKTGKKVSTQYESQRAYTDEQLDMLMLDLDSLDEEAKR